MTDPTAELAEALRASPDNLPLRLMLIRRHVAAGDDTLAADLVLDVAPEAVTAEADRQMMGDLMRRIGLTGRADAFAPAATGTADAAPVPAPAAPPAAPAAPAVPEVTRTGLRVVGGTETPEAPEDPDRIDFSKVGGLEEVKRDIRRRIVLPFAQPSLVARFRKKAGGGVLLYGAPGCGKTLLARATAGECGATFLSASLADILDGYSGVAEKRLSALFAKARQGAPTVLFFDEIEGLAMKRSGATASHNAQLVSHFLSELDGVGADNSGVLILAATNAPWAMDGAFLRPGRFDRLFFVPPPDAPARASILTLEMEGRPTVPGLDLEAAARRLSGASGADLRAVVDVATDAAIDATLERGEEVPIDQAMLDAAVTGHRTTVTDWLATARDYATYANESGRYDDVLGFLDKHGGGR